MIWLALYIAIGAVVAELFLITGEDVQFSTPLYWWVVGAVLATLLWPLAIAAEAYLQLKKQKRAAS